MNIVNMYRELEATGLSKIKLDLFVKSKEIGIRVSKLHFVSSLLSWKFVPLESCLVLSHLVKKIDT